MPRKTDAVPIGVAPCLECGHENAVFQNAKNYLYMRGCPGCGTADQRISEPVQTRLFYTLKTGEGAVVERPRNVPETRPEWIDEKPAPAPATPPAGTVQVPPDVPTPEPTRKAGKGGAFFIFAGVAGLLAALLGIAANVNLNTTRTA